VANGSVVDSSQGRLSERILEPATRPIGLFAQFADQMKFWLQSLKGMGVAIKYRKLIITQISEIVVGAGALIVGGGMLFVIFTLSFFTGTQVGLQGHSGLEQLGAEAYVGLIGSWANTREITPLIAGVALAAKIGAGFTAEIGAMRINEEIDACEVMAVPSIPYIVSTRIWAALIPTIPLYLAALFSSYLATEIIVTQFYDVSPGAWNSYFSQFLPASDILYSLAKAIVFTFVVILIHTYYGYYAGGGPSGVGTAVGRAIRASITVVVVLNMLMSIIFWYGQETVRIAG
jgi:phospholipid/cholesterol/gamma-HCH transport system permease protein